MGVLQQRLKEMRIKRGLTLAEVGEKIGVQEATVQRYETGTIKNIKHEIVTKFAEVYNCEPSYLMGWQDIEFVAKNEFAKAVRVKVYGAIPAGLPLEAIEATCGWEEIPGEWIRGGKEYIALKVKGDSMYPKYLENDTVIIRIQPDCESGQDCACYVNGYDATLKTVCKGLNAITLKPINPMYPPKTYAHPGEVKIIGKVVEIRRSV